MLHNNNKWAFNWWRLVKDQPKHFVALQTWVNGDNFTQCVVPENVHTPPTEGIWNVWSLIGISRGVGRS